MTKMLTVPILMVPTGVLVKQDSREMEQHAKVVFIRKVWNWRVKRRVQPH